ncbi:MAG: primosomal protein N' [Candidatus Muiribacterium halophilum]|uniref:Replication restart protein PriA n=1 Tax=Muiribacterium halophilum TaxID=2053465 RepID=A0A2N5ZMP0_MUIH1|nr:MAG: primosomal protein N' [Candidatus Muirbacterium halophilum]
MQYAQVLINLPFDKKYTYSFSTDMRPEKGDRVIVPFGKKNRKGIIINVQKELPDGVDAEKIKNIEKLYPEYFRLTEFQFEIARRIWRYYLSSYSQALFTVAGAFKPVRIKKKKLTSNPYTPFLLNKEQESCVREFNESDNNIFLLHGVTGSGKTEVYFELISQVLKNKKQILFLLPEISLTPQLLKRFCDRFGEDICVFNSSLSNGERNYAFKAFKDGKVRILLGTRSAVFLPAQDLGLIIIDEEHENTFKQQDTPCYDARMIANWRVELEEVRLVMGSATPRMESFYKARRNIIKLLSLEKRADNRKMPEVNTVTMGETDKVSKNISRRLYNSINESLQRREQVLIFINRRGYSSFVMCQACNEVIRCINCNISLNYHKKLDRLLCHYCGYTKRLPEACGECGEPELKLIGSGTEKLEDELSKLFPEKNIFRVDKDTSSKKDFYFDFFEKMKQRKIDILIGTQMIGKGFDFPYVTLSSVLCADFILDFPDFRSAERTMQLLIQVAGRSGRGIEGKVIIQSYAPDHYAVESAVRHSYQYFYEKEIESRKIMRFPPFISLVRLILRAKDKRNLFSSSREIVRILKESLPAKDILGPAEAPISYIKGRHRFNILLKLSSNRKKYYKVIRNILENNYKGVDIKIDVDPVDMF